MKQTYSTLHLCSEKRLKAILSLVVVLLFATPAWAQMKLGDNPNTINASAILEMESTNKGLLLPRMTHQQMASITTPVPGMVVYVSDSGCAFLYTTGTWMNLCSAPGLTQADVIRIIAENAHNQPLIDSIYHAVLLRSGSLTSPSGAITIGSGAQATLHNATIDVNPDSIVSIVTHSGRDITAQSPLAVSGGSHAALSAVSISIDSNRLVPTGGTPGQILIKDSSGSSVWGVAAGDNWGSQVIFHNNTLAGNGTTTSPLTIDSFGLAIEIQTQPARDTILSIVHGDAHDLIAGSSLVSVTGGTGATLVNASIDVNKDTLVSTIVNSPVLHDSIIKIVADNSNHSPLRDSIFSTVVAQGRNITAASPITVTGGTGASLQNIAITIDSNRLVPNGGTPNQVLIRDSFGGTTFTDVSTLVTGDNWGTQVIAHDATLAGNGTAASPLKIDSFGLALEIQTQPARDTVLSIVHGNASNVTGVSPIAVAGGTGASLAAMSISIDSNRLVPTGGTPGQILIKDSSGSSVWGVAAGDNWGSQVIFHNNTLAGNGTTTSPLTIDSFGLAIEIQTEPTRDTILSIVHGDAHDLTAGSSLVTVTGGSGATLVNASVDINKDTLVSTIVNSPVLHDSIIKIVADNSNHSPLRDSIFSTVVAQGRNITAASPITVTGGTGASLQNVAINIDSNRLVPNGGTPNQVLIRDSFGGTTFTDVSTLITGDNWGTQVVVHNSTLTGNGTAASPLSIDTIGLAHVLPVSPVSDTIVSIIGSHAHDLTSGSPALAVTNGVGTTLKNTSVTVDSLRLIQTLINSGLVDSLFKGFNISGTSTSNSFLSLTLLLGSSPDVASAYEAQTLTNLNTYPQFNNYNMIANTTASYFTAPVAGYYNLTYSVSLLINPSLLSVGGTFSWGIAIIKDGSTPVVLQSSRSTQVLSASTLGLGPGTIGTNSVSTLVRLNAGEKVYVGLGATNAITLGLISSSSTIQHFSGNWVK
ncbi:MAG: hypothetical protein JST90_12500 [Bacteroidetes bacterium]|nr:hypothetical protein [Bacteroidota bacterium]